MNTKRITFVTAMGLLTMLTLGASIWVWLFLVGPNSITRLNVIPSDNMLVLLIVGLSVYLCGGELWGLGIARMMNADIKSMVSACAISWVATGFLGATVLGLSLGLVFLFGSKLPDCCHAYHYYFLSIFVPVIGIATAINAYVVTGKLGFHELKKTTGLYAGIAGALGFLVVGLILLYGLGWEVGKPVPGKYEMLLLMEFCNLGAAFAGGTAIGWVLAKSKVDEH